MTTIDASTLGTLTEIGRGGQGKLYLAPNLVIGSDKGPLVYKKYSAKIRAESGQVIGHSLPGLIDYPRSLSDADQVKLMRWSVWPKALVVENGNALGLAMKLIPPTFEFMVNLSCGPSPCLYSADFLFGSVDSQKSVGAPTPDTMEKALFVVQLMLAMKHFHTNDLVIGDFSPRNIVVSNPEKVPASTKGGRFHPKFLDVDSFRLAGESAPIAQPDTPLWFAPEKQITRDELKRMIKGGKTPAETAHLRARLAIQNKASDVFKFGLFVLRLFDGTDDAMSLYHSTRSEATLKKLFGTKRSQLLLSTISENPAARPTFDEIMRRW
ncbi:hypothetical protein EEB13_10120 [Rhodococcus sp. WS3]|uniref:hypothetical protein n=1 Tax=Rhodococcus sp. WS3 TaxID=2486271 RepID=UPI0011442D1B|nr:hypothetical protein [Rhodococcus sp. WS3]ROZ50162.1 hypothetical protein EEB13_10120 [Rhodococcus sp. WS3]